MKDQERIQDTEVGMALNPIFHKSPPFTDDRFSCHSSVWELCRQRFQQHGRSLDLVHARISMDFAIRLMAVLGGDPNIIIPGVLLHDIGNTEIETDDLEKRTINPGTQSAKNSYSTKLKQRHLDAGRRLSKMILQQAGYNDTLVEAISEIVGDHENQRGDPPDDRTDINKVIVSEADKLYRFSASGCYHMCRIHDITQEAMLKLNTENISRWLITDEAKAIALEELRKMPGAEVRVDLMAL